MFVTEKALETEKSHLEGFAAEVLLFPFNYFVTQRLRG